jgi:hypothetical protein
MRLNVFADMREFPQQQPGPMEAILHDVKCIIRRLDRRVPPLEGGRRIQKRQVVHFDGLTPVQRLAVQELAQKEDISPICINTERFRW